MLSVSILPCSKSRLTASTAAGDGVPANIADASVPIPAGQREKWVAGAAPLTLKTLKYVEACPRS